MLDPDLVIFLARDEDRLIEQIDGPMRLGREIARDTERHLKLGIDRQVAIVTLADRPVGELAVQHVEDGAPSVRGRDDIIGAMNFVVV